jgi:ribosome maturation factor RimP
MCRPLRRGINRNNRKRRCVKPSRALVCSPRPRSSRSSCLNHTTLRFEVSRSQTDNPGIPAAGSQAFGTLARFAHLDLTGCLTLAASLQSETLKERLEAMITELLASAGLELYDLELTTRQRACILRVLVDRPGGYEEGQGVTMEEIVQITREISTMLDVEDPIEQAYRLEVFSPGVERTLTRPRHYEALKGARVHVVLNRVIDRVTSVDGQLQGVEADNVLVLDDQGTVWRLPLIAIKRANTVYDWS